MPRLPPVTSAVRPSSCPRVRSLSSLVAVCRRPRVGRARSAPSGGSGRAAVSARHSPQTLRAPGTGPTLAFGSRLCVTHPVAAGRRQHAPPHDTHRTTARPTAHDGVGRDRRPVPARDWNERCTDACCPQDPPRCRSRRPPPPPPPASAWASSAPAGSAPSWAPRSPPPVTTSSPPPGLSAASAERAARLLPGVPLLPTDEVVAAADLVVLAVPDDTLPGLVAGLAETGVWRAGPADLPHLRRARPRRARRPPSWPASCRWRCTRP